MAFFLFLSHIQSENGLDGLSHFVVVIALYYVWPLPCQFKDIILDYSRSPAKLFFDFIDLGLKALRDDAHSVGLSGPSLPKASDHVLLLDGIWEYALDL